MTGEVDWRDGIWKETNDAVLVEIRKLSEANAFTEEILLLGGR